MTHVLRGGSPHPAPIPPPGHSISVDSELGYFLIIVFGLPILLLLLTGPGMWSEKWGWGALDRVESWFRRRSGRRSGQPARDLLDRAIDPDQRRVDR
jgi:hypothetical protein